MNKIKKRRWLKLSAILISFILPFAVYFSFFPIYEGDFSNLGITPKTTIEFSEQKTLTVVVLPNCPYCYQSILLMKKLKERNPQIIINYWISTSDSLPPKSAILKVIPKNFTSIQKYNTAEISALVKGTFPCFILSEKRKTIKLWNNNQFGVCALDEIEEFFKSPLKI